MRGSQKAVILRAYLFGLSVSGCAEAPSIASTTQAISSADGEDTGNPTQFPMVVEVRGGCTGTLISPTHVLTAAHCVQARWEGSVSFTSTRDGSQEVEIARCAMQPAYTFAMRSCIQDRFLGPEGDTAAAARALGTECGVLDTLRRCPFQSGTSSTDLAVLQLARPIPLPGSNPGFGATDGSGRFLGDAPIFVAPADLYSGGTGVVETVTAVGFGITNGAGDGAGVRRFRSLADVRIRNPIDLGSRFITGSGDPGGPLLLPTPTGFEVVAVAHSGFGTGFAGDAVWTGLDEDNRRWIESQVDQNDDGRADLACRSSGSIGADPGANPSTDADGDGTLDADDTCPTLYNPCQRETDFDGDGVPDDCDACPLDADVSVERGDGSVNDTDGDGLADECDCEPNFARADFIFDVDDDLIPIACDNCSEIANPLQENADGDSRGDACDLCPDVAETVFTDSDDDGIPDACDNCPADENPLQANCNLDAELARNEMPQGDLCDPVPCGETQVLGSREVLDDGTAVLRMDRIEVDALASEEITATTGFRFCRCPVADADALVTRRRCQDLFGTLGGCDLGNPDAYDSFDRESRPWRHDSIELGGSGIIVEGDLDESLRQEQPASYDPVEPDSAPEIGARWRNDQDRSRWARIAAEEQALVDSGMLDPNDRRFPLEEDDFPGDEPLRGVLWTHTPRLAIPNPDGSFSAGPTLDNETRALSSHYWSGSVLPDLEARAPVPCLRYVGPLSVDGCTVCSQFPRGFIGVGGIPGGAGPCSPNPIEPPRLALPDLDIDFAASLGVTLPSPFDPRVVHPGEAFADENVRWLSPAEPVEWLTGRPRVDGQGVVNPPSPNEISANAPLRLLGLSLGASGSPSLPSIRYALRQEGAELAMRRVDVPISSFPPPCQFEFCEPIEPIESPQDDMVTLQRATSPAGGGVEAQAALDTQWVLSARHHVLWRIESSGRVAAYRLATAQPASGIDGRITVQEEIVRHVPQIAGRLLSATYRPQDDALYVLARVRIPARRRGWRGRHRRGHHRARRPRTREVVRLVRVARSEFAEQLDVDVLTDEEVEAGAEAAELRAMVVGQWPRVAHHAEYALAGDPTGALWVVAAGRRSHVVFRLRPVNHTDHRARPWRSDDLDGAFVWVPVGWAWGSGTLERQGNGTDSATLPIVADGQGLSLVVRPPRSERGEVIGYRPADLRRVWWRDLSRCF